MYKTFSVHPIEKFVALDSSLVYDMSVLRYATDNVAVVFMKRLSAKMNPFCWWCAEMF